MFEKFAQMIQNLQNCQNPFDPSQFDDPIATQTGWRPIKSGGSNFRTYKLVQVNPSRLEFKSTIGAIIFALLFFLPGAALLIFFTPTVNWSSMNGGTMIPLGLGLIFSGLGGYLLYSQMLPIVFDKEEGLFWKNRKPQAENLPDETVAKSVRLETIHALQIIAEYINGKNGGYYSYELNLVLKNGNRINVIDHGKRNKISEDAGFLAAFLGVPVWDATMGNSQANPFSITRNG